MMPENARGRPVRGVPFASHRTLVFSTDEAVVGRYLERLRPRIGRTDGDVYLALFAGAAALSRP